MLTSAGKHHFLGLWFLHRNVLFIAYIEVSMQSSGPLIDILGWFFLVVLLRVDSLVVDAARFRTPESDLILEPVGAAPTHTASRKSADQELVVTDNILALRVASNLALRSAKERLRLSNIGMRMSYGVWK